MDQTEDLPEEVIQPGSRVVLHVGCGPRDERKLHPVFRGAAWREIRIDIDRRVVPDVASSITALPFASSAADAVWSSHNIEHLYAHEIPLAFGEFKRVLSPRGFALITTPDLAAVARLIADEKADTVAYNSPAGPITPIDMVFGHGASIARGNPFMAHRTGFTASRLSRLLEEAGFAKVVVRTGGAFELWAVAMMEEARVHIVE